MIEQLFRVSLDHPLIWLWLLVSGLFLLFFLIQIIYFFRFYIKLLRHKKINIKSSADPVSVIICAKNEAENLKKFLPSVLNQFYPDFEVIVVNDGSTDETEEVLAEFKRIYPHLYVTGIEGKPGYISGKKVAQTIGIKAAKNEQLIFTDADCEPKSPNWIRHMQSNFLQKTDIIIGYGGYKASKGLLNKWIRIDTVYIALQYLSFALKGIPFMGVGRNLAYRRSLFFKNKGFASHLHIVSGDDDLFVNETANRYNTSVEIQSESHTLSEPKTTWKQWIRQKRRHYTTGFRYKKRHKVMLSLEMISRELFFIAGIVLLAFKQFTGYVVIIFFIREILFLIFFKLSMKRLKEKNLLLLSLVYDIIWPFIASLLVLRNKIAPKHPKWK